MFNRLSHWDTPTRNRQSRKPTDNYISTVNDIASATSTLDSPMGA